MTQYALIAALLGAVGLSGFLWLQTSKIDALRAENERLTRNGRVLTDQVAQARLAADVADAHAQRERAIAADAAATIEQIRNLNLGECADAPLDPDLSNVLDRLRTQD